MYDSGNGPIFFDRVSWALSSLALTGLVNRPKRGIYQINDVGRSLLKKPGELADYIKAKVAERKAGQQQERTRSEKTLESLGDGPSDLTSQEQLYASYEDIRQSIYDDIIDTILSKSPRAFEELVVRLLEKMGYGGQVKNAGEVTQYSNDGGIDGVV